MAVIMRVNMVASTLFVFAFGLTCASPVKEAPPPSTANSFFGPDPIVFTELAADFEAASGCDKQAYLWTQIQQSEYARGELPPLKGPDIPGLILSRLKTKLNWESDQAPKGWDKPIHRHGSVAMVAFESNGQHPYTGLFQGSPCGLLRLSFLSKDQNDVSPGLALKLFADQRASANLSALYSLDGQGENHNIFAQVLSTAVDEPQGFAGKFSSLIFSRASSYPRRIGVAHFAQANAQGENVDQAVAPLQLFFRPLLNLPASKHDFREGLSRFAAETPIYEVLALGPQDSGLTRRQIFESKNVDLMRLAKPIGVLKLTSEFVASSYGDLGLFFRHRDFTLDIQDRAAGK